MSENEIQEHDPIQCTCYECLDNEGYGLQQAVLVEVRGNGMTQITCPRCFGYGHLVADDAVIVASWTDSDGMATVIHADCPRCNGRGQIVDPQEEREAKFLREQEAQFVKRGYSPERAAELATWELHVRSGGD